MGFAIRKFVVQNGLFGAYISVALEQMTKLARCASKFLLDFLARYFLMAFSNAMFPRFGTNDWQYLANLSLTFARSLADR